MRNIPYKIIMSRGDDIPLDTDEIEKVLKGIASGQPVMVKTGIFNPSFYVSITKDVKRWANFLEDIKYQENKKELLIKGAPQLKNIFEDTVLKLQIKN